MLRQEIPSPPPYSRACAPAPARARLQQCLRQTGSISGCRNRAGARAGAQAREGACTIFSRVPELEVIFPAPASTYRHEAAFHSRGRTGVASEWERIVREHGPLVYGTAWRILGHAADTEDVVQEVFIQVHQMQQTRPVRCWWALLRRLAACRALDRLRQRRPTVPLDGVLVA